VVVKQINKVDITMALKYLYLKERSGNVNALAQKNVSRLDKVTRQQQDDTPI